MSAEIRHFEDFELDPGAYRLSRGGEPVRLERIPLELLFLLVDRSRQIVTREEILERIWGKGVFIDSEHAINTAVRKIRRALGDDADAPRFIVTIPGKGYRFVAPVVVPNSEFKPVLLPNGEVRAHRNTAVARNGKSADFPPAQPISEQSQPRRRSYATAGLLAAAGLAIIAGVIVTVPHLSPRALQPAGSKPSAEPPPQLPNGPSIAVLPFTNLSADREQEYFSDGITNDLITDLSRLPGLFVIARESTVTYKGKEPRLQDVSRELGVKYVLSGGVRKAAGQLRITVQLADATTGVQLWAERYDRPMRDVFALQDEVVRRIVTTLRLQLTLSQQGVVIPRNTENIEAYDDVLRGMAYLLSYTKEGTVKAGQMFASAIRLDPEYAAAYALEAMTYYFGWAYSFNPSPDALERGLQAAQRAVALDDSLAFAHSALAFGYIHRNQNAHIWDHNWQNDQALTEARRAIALDSNSAFSYATLAEILNMQAKYADALVAIEKAIRLDPRNRVDHAYAIGYAYTHLERWQEAIRAFKPYFVRYPDHLWAHAWLAIDYFNVHDHEHAQAETAQIASLAARNPSAIGYSVLAMVLNTRGRPADALAAAEKGISFDPHEPSVLSNQAGALLQLGRLGQALSVSKQYVALYPDHIGSRTLLVIVYSALGQMDDARREAAELERIVAIDPGTFTGYRSLAAALNATGRPTEALAAAVKAMRLYPSSGPFPPYSQCEQGRAYTQLGRWQEATHALNDCLARHPDQVGPHVDLAVNYIRLGQDEAARAEVAEISRLNPDYSLKLALESEFPAQQERAADLSRAGLK